MRHSFKGIGAGRNIVLPATAIFAAFATNALAQDVTRADWRMNRTSEIVTVPGVSSPANGDPLAFVYAPPIPDANAPGWEPAPDPQIIAFKGHNGDEISRLAEGTCLQAFDYVFFDTVVTVPQGAQVSDFSIGFTGMDDGSRITIFNEAYPSGTPDMPNGVNNFVAYDQNVTMDLAQFLRTGQNRVVITQVDDCPAGNKLRAAEVVLNGSVIAAPATATPEPALRAGSEGVQILAYGDVHIRSLDGLSYDFQVPGDFIATSSADRQFMSQIRTEPSTGDPAVSVAIAFAAHVDGDVVEVYDGGTLVVVNGVEVELTSSEIENGPRFYKLPQGGIIQSSPPTAQDPWEWVSIDRYPPGHPLPIEDNMRFMGFAFMPGGSFASVGIVPMPKQPNAFGLSGLQDGDPANDMTLRSGEVIAQPASQAEINRFGESWRVTAEENLFRHRPPAPSAPPPAPVVMAELPEETRTSAATTCLQNGVIEINLLRDCTYDVAMTGDSAFAAATADVQVADATVADLPSTERADGSNPIDDIGETALAAARAAAGVNYLMSEHLAGPASHDDFDLHPFLGGLMGGIRRNQRIEAGEYAIEVEKDGNLCIRTVEGNRLVWCVSNDPNARFDDTNAVVMNDIGELVAMTWRGEILYAYPPEPTGIPSDISISPKGEVSLVNKNGIVWSFDTPARVDNSGQNAPAATDVQTELPEETPEAPPEPAAEPVAGPEPAPETLREGIAGVVTREQRFAMDGYYMTFQADGNLCIYTEADNGFVWCVNNDPSIRYADTAEVVMTTGGQLMGLDAAGEVLYAYPPEPTGMPSDIFISSEGKVTMANETGTIWTFN
ncbi:hypothetical protein [Gemmobacter nanjingensis]|uniref:hypothetical protein n=1 Tax=Gemmobacter nanjingensis TaxID=488454 RepID=UPI00167A241B|nr:hypothetical protein [Gemmobacter nanjingensis]